VDVATQHAGPLHPFGRYRLCFEIASGGMATVYLARQESDAGFEKIVAVKVVHRHLAGDPRFTEMFLDEARLAARIDHPHVCSVFDFGQVEGQYYLAMEYLLGESLLRVGKEVARRKQSDELSRLPWLVARIFADACEGLHAAHELTDERGEPLGVVHRDVTPQNLIITYEGSVKVVDFGVAKAASQLHTTEAGKIKGKLAYVSPEQVANRPLDRRTDVWAVGVCLWEMLTLKRLFRRDSEAATLMAVAHDPVPPPSEVRSWVPPALDDIVMGALCRDLDARTPNARVLGRALARFLTTSGVSVGMPELSEWMQSMFAAEHAQRRELIRRARAAVEPGPLPLPSAETSSTDSMAPSVSLEVPVRAPAPAQRSRWRTPVAVVALVAAVGAGYYAARIEPAAAPQPAGAAPDAERAEPTTVTPTATSAPSPAPAARTGAGADAATSDGTGLRDPPRAPPPAAEGPVAAPAKARARASRRRRRERATAPAETAPAGSTTATGTGHVVVLGSGGGWAEVYAGSRHLGRTPLRAELPAGTHRLRILPNGEEPAHFEPVVVERDSDVLLRLRIHEP
jgi:serine/threonine-protein kinase